MARQQRVRHAPLREHGQQGGRERAHRTYAAPDPGSRLREAERLAEQFGLEGSRIEDWHQRTQELPANQHTNFSTSRTLEPQDGKQLAVTLESADSFNAAAPWIISLSFYWLSER